MNQVGVVVAGQGSAIVTVAHRPMDDVVIGIEQLPFDIDIAATRVTELAAETKDARFILDSEGLGSALWKILVPDPRKHPDRAALYVLHGLDRQQLVDGLVVAMHDQTLHFAAGLAGQEAMTKALLGYRRQVREDGLIGSELVVALCLAISRPPARKGGWAFLA